MEKLKIGFIGLGARGMILLKDVVLAMKDISVIAVCDNDKDRAQVGAEAVIEARGSKPACETDYKKVIDHPEVEAVIIATAWEYHVEIAVYSMLSIIIL